MNDILSKIKDSNSISITCHTSPDGDALGSVLALASGLKQLGKEVTILSKEDVTSNLPFLVASQMTKEAVAEVPENSDCVIVLDCGNVERINAELVLENREYCLLNIDHHQSNDGYGDINFVDVKAAATGEVVYDILKSLEIDITKDIADCLYTALLTDTGSFRFSNTTQKTHVIAGELINYGVNVDNIYRTLFENKTFHRIKFYGEAIQTMELHHDSQICIIKLSSELLNKLNLKSNVDTSDVLTFGTQIDTVEVVALLKEANPGVKISLRSKNSVDVRKIAENFGGGGHSKASGLFIDNNIDDVEKIIIKAIENELI
jgi:phosphoesterase RecJ-like protein